MNQPPAPPPEGVLIESARRDAGLSVREASRRAGISEGWWRQVVKGYQSLSGGAIGTVQGVPADTVAKMALAARVTPEQMEAEGRRPDAAGIMRRRPIAVPVRRPAARDPYPFGKPSEAMARDLDALDGLKKRLERYVEEHPGEVAGSELFPLDPRRQVAWDTLAAKFEGDLNLVIAGFLVWMVMDAQEEAENRRQGGSAAGLMRRRATARRVLSRYG